MDTRLHDAVDLTGRLLAGYVGPMFGSVIQVNGDPRLEELSRDELIKLLEARGEGGIHIDFSGKANARQLARRVRPRVARSIKKYSAGPEADQARNLIVEGDNLQAMATLFRERGQVDLILTDPPYNTGNDWRYNDKWEDDPNDDGIGEWVTAEDGARHTKWMRFMWPRLQMMKSMLKPGGVLAICIDFRELFRLGQMLDELFRQENRLGIINWQRTYSRTNDATHLATTTEYVLVYARDEDKAHSALLPRAAIAEEKPNPDQDPEPWTDGPATASNAKAHKSMVYGIQSPFTGDILYPPSGSAWRLEQARNLEYLSGWNCKFELRDLDDIEQRATLIGVGTDEVPDVKGIVLAEPVETAQTKAQDILDSGIWPRFFFLRRGQGKPRLKKYISELKAGIVPTTFWAAEDFETPDELGAVSWGHRESGHSQQGVEELTSVVGKGHEFKTVKPIKLFRRILEIWCPPDGLVMDPFAGSGTTGHAVLAMNQEQEHARRFILVEQGRPDRGDSYARSLTADRLTRVITGKWQSGKKQPVAGGYRFVALGKKVDAEALLSMEREDLAGTIIASHFDAGARRRDALIDIPASDAYKYLVGRNAESEGFFLIWN
ncbi:MAG: adenine-specific DNA-methyltransferase, partial [Solirubrobacterales bacterium]|nr:adenine-specific DNA-methyltransferase [Solirubrobacterales bacterium]